MGTLVCQLESVANPAAVRPERALDRCVSVNGLSENRKRGLLTVADHEGQHMPFAPRVLGSV